MVHQTMIVHDPRGAELRNRLPRRLPRRRRVALGPRARKSLQNLNTPIKHGLLLLRAQMRGEFVRVPVQA